MICPKCGIADIAEDTGRCVLCGYELHGAVRVAAPTDHLRQAVEHEVGDRLRVEEVAGIGRRSIVYRARHLKQNHLVALKATPLGERMDPDLVQRFRQEARIASTLSHSHVVPIFEFGTARALLWYTMEYIDGPTLALLLRDEGVLGVPDCLRIVEQVASALDYMHRRGVIHGNLKPTNVLMDHGKWARVSDPAVLKVTGRGRKGPRGLGAAMPEYIAPEQFELRTLGPTIDQYALACIAHECLTGSPPFVGDSNEEVEDKHRGEAPPSLRDSLDDVPDSVNDALQRALSKAPAARFGSVLDFVTMMRESHVTTTSHLFAAAPSAAPATSSPVVLIDPKRRRWPLVAGILGAVATAGVLATVIISAITGGGAGAESEFVTVELPLDPMLGSVPATPDSGNVPTPGAGAVEVQPVLPSTQAVTPARRSPRPARRQPPAPLPGRLFVASTPWGQLFIDGEPMGNTPKANFEIAAGVHTLRIERDAFETYEIEITVEPGREIRLINIRLQPRSR